jgi:hypothetical protein
MKRFPFILRAPDGDTPGGAAPKIPDAPPAAAEVVLGSDAKEGDAAEIVRLNRELSERDGKLKKHETRISELEDENRTLKNPQPVPIKKADDVKKSFLKGFPFD